MGGVSGGEPGECAVLPPHPIGLGRGGGGGEGDEEEMRGRRSVEGEMRRR